MHEFCPSRHSRIAQWHNHLHRTQVPASLRHWLTDRGSLTSKLIAHCDHFRVQRIYQRAARCWEDEFDVLGLPRAGKVHAREVLLRCDERATIYAHTVMPIDSDGCDWPHFRRLGNRSLGTTLFNDPKVRRGPMQYARLHPQHPAMLRARSLTGQQFVQNQQAPFDTALWARRSLFFRGAGVMLVTELFLPAVADLKSI